MQKRALVVGLGSAGMSAAIGLRRAGWTPVIVERAPERRTGGADGTRSSQVLGSVLPDPVRRVVHRRLAAEFTAAAAVPSGTAR